MVSFKKKEFAPLGSKFFPFRADPFFRCGQKTNEEVQEVLQSQITIYLQYWEEEWMNRNIQTFPERESIPL